MTQMTPDTDRFLADLEALRQIGAFRTGVHRPTFSKEDMQSRAWLMEQMREVGLEPEMDGIGNVLEHLESADEVEPLCRLEAFEAAVEDGTSPRPGEASLGDRKGGAIRLESGVLVHGRKTEPECSLAGTDFEDRANNAEPSQHTTDRVMAQPPRECEGRPANNRQEVALRL